MGTTPDPAINCRLPACPACSTLSTVERPSWRRARHVSAKTGRPTFSLTGCKHAEEVLAPSRLVSEEEEIVGVEDAWAHNVEALFAVKVEGWSSRAIHDFRRNLDDGVPIPPGTNLTLQL